MEAGHDDLLVKRGLRRLRRLPGSIRQNPLLYAGVGMVVLGLTAVLSASLFFVVFEKSTAELEGKLNARSSPAVQQPLDLPGGELGQAREDQATSTPTASPSGDAFPTADVARSPSQEAGTPESEPAVVSARVQLPASVISGARLFPGEALKAVFWSDPLAFEPQPPIDDFLRPYQPVTPEDIRAAGALSVPTRLIVPSIGVESTVEELGILDLGNSRAYETPKNVVGHIPTTANPGEAGSVWLFGHLESPINNEGNVFSQLPKIPDLLRKGEDVYAVVEGGQKSYLYQIMESKVLPQEQLWLSDTGAPQLVMVACVPRLIYDHRLIVTGELIGVKG